MILSLEATLKKRGGVLKLIFQGQPQCSCPGPGVMARPRSANDSQEKVAGKHPNSFPVMHKLKDHQRSLERKRCPKSNWSLYPKMVYEKVLYHSILSVYPTWKSGVLDLGGALTPCDWQMTKHKQKHKCCRKSKGIKNDDEQQKQRIDWNFVHPMCPDCHLACTLPISIPQTLGP